VNTFALRIWDDECSKVTFYTVHQDEHTLCETDNFFAKYGQEEIHKEAVAELSKFMTNSLGKLGALDRFFNRHEQSAFALPPKGRFSEFTLGFPLRLYCYRVSENIVILFNGGVKTSQTVQESPDLIMKFRDA
jgi:hypothetical protein